MEPPRRPGTFSSLPPSTPPLHGRVSAASDYYPAPPPPLLGNVRQRSSSGESSDASPQQQHRAPPHPHPHPHHPSASSHRTSSSTGSGGGGSPGPGIGISAMAANKRAQFPPRMPGSSTPMQGGGLSPGSGGGSGGGGGGVGGGGGSLASSPGTSQNFSRPSIAQIVSDTPQRKNSPLNPGPPNDPRSHKRNNSQGFFEPSLPTASLTSAGIDNTGRGDLSPSYIAAQAAMQQQQQQQQQLQQQQLQQQQQMPTESQMVRKRSQTVPSPQDFGGGGRGRPQALPVMQTAMDQRTGLPVVQYPQQQSSNSPTSAAALAASNVAYPRGTPQMSPGLTNFAELDRDSSGKETRGKEKGAKMKLFSKPRNIGISSYRDQKEKDRPLPSPNKTPSIYSRGSGFNASTTSLGEISAPPSIYSMANSSTSTLVPSDKQKEEKEKGHRHNIFGRQKKYKEKPDEHSLNLPSAGGSTKPADSSSIYNFGPPSPGLQQGTFAKSVSGFDLRHGGRALREKKHLAAEPRRGEETPGTFGLAPLGTPTLTLPGEFSGGPLQGYGTSNIAPEDAWSFLKAKLLVIFSREELRMPVEDLNHLVSIYVQRCVRAREPTTIVEDLSDLFNTGFLSLNETLRGIPEGQLVRALVDMWLFVFGVVLPQMQAAFLPLDLEFSGHGAIMTTADASEFWGRELRTDVGPEAELDVRKLVLLSYRDAVILPRHDILKNLFSRLSLESIQMVATTMDGSTPAPPLPPFSPAGAGNRPGTAGSLGPGSAYGSYNSQGSTLRSSSSGGDGSGARSRATSNTSAPELPPFSPTSVGRNPAQREQVQQLHSQAITETVGRMLQCLSVLSSLRSDDDHQRRCEALTTALKLNWLGRGRTGRNRKGFVGARVPMRPGGVRVGG